MSDDIRLIGLTGSIGMGKSTAAKQLAELGVPVHCADQVVHNLMAAGGAAVEEIANNFNDVLQDDGSINRKALGQQVFNNPAALKKLEVVLHPKVRTATKHWIATQIAQGARLVVLDIPLLFETYSPSQFDEVWVVSAPREVQMQRVLARAGMTAERFAQIEALQTSDAEKRAQATVVIPTGLGLETSMRYLKEAVEQSKNKTGSVYPLHWQLKT